MYLFGSEVLTKVRLRGRTQTNDSGNKKQNPINSVEAKVGAQEGARSGRGTKQGDDKSRVNKGHNRPQQAR